MEGVLQLATQLRELGHSNEAVTLDAPGEVFFAHFPGEVHALGPSRGGYRYNSRLVPWLRREAHRYDAVIVNGLWQYHSFGAWRALAGMDVPYYVFPHGMLDPWFRRTYPLKHMKKWLYWPWGDYRVLRDARAVLFTCEEERRLAGMSFALYRANERVVAFGICAPPADSVQCREAFLATCPALRDQRLLLFLGRLHEKKGCDLLIHAFASLVRSEPRLKLVMAGPDQTGWARSLQDLARSLGVAEHIAWPGMLSGDAKWGAFRSAEAFVLPSHQENFGIAVVEALGCGVPTLISDKVNIWREIAGGGAGCVESDDLDGTRRLLARWLSLDAAAKRQMRVSALRLFDRQFNVEAMAYDFLNLLTEGVGRLSPEPP
jgi:glycosyltransferase involved in cell wall biosynthesis